MVRRECTISSSLTWTSNKKSDGTEEFAMTGSVDGCKVLLKTQFAGIRLCLDNTLVLSVGGSLTPMGAGGKTPEFASNHL